ncbi:hypothetical protein NC653_005935 [Populus alba x Populus x berolinensis]|uniref:Uncharacterized protein n=1 Tax=Populus alba x Populus x berolinensis TaxID=444605 RepID=A0AAD6WBK2_9ROSI|nr:hypothetical protein NC653_005935 [Populus alba x Populus x berolinensis]
MVGGGNGNVYQCGRWEHGARVAIRQVNIQTGEGQLKQIGQTRRKVESKNNGKEFLGRQQPSHLLPPLKGINAAFAVVFHSLATYSPDR